MAELKDGIITFHAKSRKAWRQWLDKNHQKEKSLWLIIYKKGAGTPSVYYSDAVDEALCYGWIDSKANKRNEESYYQFFSQRNPKSNWSRVNKEKVARLIQNDLMMPAGFKMIEQAKATGTWVALDEVENLTIPADLQALFNNNKTALENWENFPKSARRGILEWILNAKKPETRFKRITETVKLAEVNVKANYPK